MKLFINPTNTKGGSMNLRYLFILREIGLTRYVLLLGFRCPKHVSTFLNILFKTLETCELTIFAI